jgi:hypothetical protein
MLVPFTPEAQALTPPLSSGTLAGLNALSIGLQATPTMVLSFYTFGVLLRRMTEDGGETEYAVSPAQLAESLAVKVRFETGLLIGNTVYIASEGMKKAVVEYRPPTKTALYLEGSETPVVVPLPGLIMGRISGGADALRYGVYAVKSRPETLDTPLFQPPLPNVGGGSICWGSVKRVSDAALTGNTLAEDWALLIGSVFTSHSVSGKSKKYSADIRQHFIDLEKRKAHKYPVSDLIPAKLTLGQWLGKQS